MRIGFSQRMSGEMEYQETLTLRSMENELLLCDLNIAIGWNTGRGFL